MFQPAREAPTQPLIKTIIYSVYCVGITTNVDGTEDALLTCMKDKCTTKQVKHNLYLSNNESQPADSTGLMPAHVTEQEEVDLVLSEDSDFEGITADDLL